MNFKSNRATIEVARAFLQIIIAIFISAIAVHKTFAAEAPETVWVTFQVKEGKADDLARLLSRSWKTYQQLGMVLAQPHMVARNSGNTSFFEIFSWKDHSMPDHAPKEVLELWGQMEALCEPRNGQPGVKIVEVEILAPQNNGTRLP
jgi:hypothetical protein